MFLSQYINPKWVITHTCSYYAQITILHLGHTHFNNMEAQLVAEFVSRTGASSNDALSCLNSWGWDLKKALIDYNGNIILDLFVDSSSN